VISPAYKGRSVKFNTHLYQVKVNFSRYRPGVTQRVGRGISLLFHDRGTRTGVSGQQHVPAALHPRERPGTHFTGGWAGPRAGLDGRKNLVPTGIRSQTVQPVVSRYPAHPSIGY